MERCSSDVFVEMIPVIISERASHFLSNFGHVTAYREGSAITSPVYPFFVRGALEQI